MENLTLNAEREESQSLFRTTQETKNACQGENVGLLRSEISQNSPVVQLSSCVGRIDLFIVILLFCLSLSIPQEITMGMNSLSVAPLKSRISILNIAVQLNLLRHARLYRDKSFGLLNLFCVVCVAFWCDRGSELCQTLFSRLSY